MRRVAAIVAALLCAACGAPTRLPASPAREAVLGEHRGARPPIDRDAIAGLPLAIEGLQSLPLDMAARTDRLLGAASYNVPCTGAIARKLTGYYWPLVDDALDLTMPQLVTGTMTVDEIVACMQKLEGGTRVPTSDPSIVALDTDHAFLVLAGGGILMARSAEELAPLAGDGASAPAATVDRPRPVTRNPLAALVNPPSTAEWTAVAKDFTWELLGVESLGVIFEYDRSLEPGPLAIRVRFRTADAAKAARDQLDHVDDVVARSALGEPVAAALAVIRSRGSLTVDGRDVLVRGRVSESDWEENPLGIFRALAVPVGRPLTTEERARLLRHR